MKSVSLTPSGEVIDNIDKLCDTNPEIFTNDRMQMDYKVFEESIRPFSFIYVRDDGNSLSFTLQNGPIKEVGVNGCQDTDVIEVAKMTIEGLSKDFTYRENARTITKLDEVLMWQKRRTKDRVRRGCRGI